ncbi:hypothetical protein FIM02_03245, partial [SAR202 cluster bacterium AD-802-E10_MRT_200m]|nr:hypothetical protein [SAR202 cluster bacterium AD-802-E10_MRT_200m]
MNLSVNNSRSAIQYLKSASIISLTVISILIGLILGYNPKSANAQSEFLILSQEVESQFPDGILFKIEASNPHKIIQVKLRFHVIGQRSSRYGNAEFQPGTAIHAQHFVRTDTASKFIPPGAEITYFFEFQDEQGSLFETPLQTFTLNDPRFDWKTIEGEHAKIRFYNRGGQQAEQVLFDANKTIQNMMELMDLTIKEPLKITLYNNIKDMQSALPPRSAVQQEALIVEGMSFGDTGVILVLGSVPRLSGVTSHEAVHFMLQQKMGGLSRLIPAWINEGLAEYGSSEPNPTFDLALQSAVRNGQLLPLTSLNVPPGRPEDVMLFYGESKSAVTFLIDNHDLQSFHQLLEGLKEGLLIDAALERAYGFDRVGLEHKWRAHIGSAPLPEADESQLSVNQPTLIPLTPFGVTTPTPFVPSENTEQPQISRGCKKGTNELDLATLV